MTGLLLAVAPPALDANANPYSGAKWHFYASGTATPQAVFADADLNNSLGAVVEADSAGRFVAIYLDASLSYRAVLESSDGSATIHDIDPVNSDALSLISGKGGAGLIGYLYSSTYASGTTGAKLQNYIDLDDFPGATDHAKLTAAAAYCKATGADLKLPDRNIAIDSDLGTITLEQVRIVGSHVLDGSSDLIDCGSMFVITGAANIPFKVRRGVTLEGVGYYYPAQVDSAAPTVFPATVSFDFSAGAVQFVNIWRCVFYNSYQAIDINDIGGNVGHVEIIGNYICGINRGIYLRHNAEHFRVERNNFTFGFWLSATEAGTRAYMRANATAMQIDQSDGVEFIDNLIFGHLNGALCAEQGLCQFMNIMANKFDQTRYGVKAAGAGNFDGQIANNTFNAFNDADTTLQGRAIDIQTTGTAVESITITANNFDSSTEQAVFVSGDIPQRNVVIMGNNLRGWAVFKADGTYAAFDINGALTNAVITGNFLNGTLSPAHSDGIAGTFNTADISSNVLNALVAPLSVTVNSAVLTGNTSFSTSGSVSDAVSSTTIWQTGNNWDKPSISSTKPAFLARKNAAQTFNSGAATDVIWGTEAHDQGGNFASPSYTAGYSGLHFFDFSLMHDNTGTAGDRWQIIMLLNGSNYKAWSYKMIADHNSVSSCAYVRLTKGDVVKLQVQRVSGAGNFVTFNDATSNYFSGVYIG